MRALMLCLVVLCGCGRMPEFIEVDGSHYVALRIEWSTSECKNAEPVEFDFEAVEDFRMRDVLPLTQPGFLWQPHYWPDGVEKCCPFNGGPFTICPCPEVTP